MGRTAQIIVPVAHEVPEEGSSPEAIARAPNMRVLVELAIEVASRKPVDDHETILVLGSSE